MLRGFLNTIGVYKIYHKWLLNQIKTGEMPNHIGVILDGNRRWAVQREKVPWEGHYAGGENVKEFLKWCLNLKIKTVTLYALSTENFNRSPRELEELMSMYEKALEEVIASDILNKYQVRAHVIGRTSLLPKTLQELIKDVEKKTENHDQFYLNVALAYGGRSEIVDATKEIAALIKSGKVEPEEINEKLIEKHLYTSHLPQPDPDLIIRTGSESRLSNFLLWQAAYSELFIVDVYWPDFREIDLERVIRDYQKRHRRYGK
ncbi:di-trans,poly-cis-decaprenylcistransferase [Candidatus Bathyarchaeota archaeon]|nr:di-trans,poly-cis-decaprenylcistransferase [Candidatus Bathyarchaeota archaeon]